MHMRLIMAILAGLGLALGPMEPALARNGGSVGFIGRGPAPSLVVPSLVVHGPTGPGDPRAGRARGGLFERGGFRRSGAGTPSNIGFGTRGPSYGYGYGVPTNQTFARPTFYSVPGYADSGFAGGGTRYTYGTVYNQPHSRFRRGYGFGYGGIGLGYGSYDAGVGDEGTAYGYGDDESGYGDPPAYGPRIIRLGRQRDDADSGHEVR